MLLFVPNLEGEELNVHKDYPFNSVSGNVLHIACDCSCRAYPCLHVGPDVPWRATACCFILHGLNREALGAVTWFFVKDHAHK